MAQGEFTKEEADETLAAEMYGGLSKARQAEYFGHLSDIALFIGAAKKVAPEPPVESR